VGSLNSDTLKIIQDTAVKASDALGKVEFVKLPGEPNHVYAAVKADGTFERRSAEAAPRAHKLASFQEAIAFVKTKGTKDNSVLWYDDTGVIVVVDDATRRDTAELKFTLTEPFERIAAIAENDESFDQRAFRRLLRVTFAGCTPNDLLLNWISDCKFGTVANAAGTIVKNRESFGKDINQAVESKDNTPCPDDITLSLRIFDDPLLRETRTVNCDVEVLVAEQKFKLTPFPLEIINAVNAELANIEGILAGEVECPVFRGRP